MASIQAHICDDCESFVDERSLHKLSIKIEPAPTFKATYNGGSAGVRSGYASRERELCAKCAQKLYDMLKLEQSTIQIPKDALDNFQQIVQPN